MLKRRTANGHARRNDEVIKRQTTHDKVANGDSNVSVLILTTNDDDDDDDETAATASVQVRDNVPGSWAVSRPAAIFGGTSASTTKFSHHFHGIRVCRGLTRVNGDHVRGL